MGKPNKKAVNSGKRTATSENIDNVIISRSAGNCKGFAEKGLMFTEVKGLVNVLDVCAAYATRLDKRNRALCPLHSEDTPSFVAYPKTNSFYCFGCCIGGDVISLVGQLFGLAPLDAVRKLDGDFHLGLLTKPLTQEQKNMLKQRERERRITDNMLAAYKAWEHNFYLGLCNEFQALERLKSKYNPSAQNGMFVDEFVLICNRLAVLEQYFEVILGDNMNDKAALYRETKGAAKIAG